MAKLLTTNNINASKCVSTIVRSLLKNVCEHTDKELDYLIRPEFIVFANILKHREVNFIFKDDILVGCQMDYDKLIREFTKNYTGSKNLKFKATLEQSEFVTNLRRNQNRKLMPDLESGLGLIFPEEDELYNPDSTKLLKDVFVKKNITLPEKVTVNELLRKLAIIYVYPMCKQFTSISIPLIMNPLARRLRLRECNELVMCGKHLGRDYFHSFNVDSIEKYLKTNEEYDENAAKYLSFIKAEGPFSERTTCLIFQFDFGAFAKLLDNTEAYFIPDDAGI